mmetsp:Transcript_8387/g.12419  ORF Transcript_8387/g.12419 Transcript_8387/m.12419 type:complete len:253 (-) Transcript_8387:197-955(-)|eukprot:CAMPEP_0196802894 /NCGR_PEP_ID=MMETSP1362-20130617/2413_1 /TAXON_ID=163516 /ORGANISM="Leptocylindrus danicus, Strain CCMP1856" /LENGTH=252 /DNA_ID=CAMNT_0042174301 /DNA_START=88 /DNA_END=846 /DNA_ORIENTATION=-
MRSLELSTLLALMLTSAARAFTSTTIMPSTGAWTRITTAPPTQRRNDGVVLQMIQRSNRRTANIDKSKRQFRVGQLVRSEIASIIKLGHEIKHTDGSLDSDLRLRISVVNADVSPDLRQARITVSVISKPNTDATAKLSDTVVEKRVAYSWLVKHTKNIRHALAQRLSHMKTIPNLTFAQADVGAAVDVMNKINNINLGLSNSRSDFGGANSPEAMLMGMGDEYYDDYDDDDEWDDEDGEFFFTDDEEDDGE